ncbi:MAG TPA: hypothetical protein VJK30_07630 [Coxiellaceae bacterium]|nr:hypothetical protein [Coxiellaceae bacterium]
MNIRVIICTIAGLLAVALLIAFTPHQNFLPKGIVLPAKITRAPISPDQVTIYNQAPSGDFTRLGDIHIEQAFTVLNAQTKDLLIQKVKDMAASIGANGVIVTLLVPSKQLRPMIIFYGAAIYSPSQTTGSKK